MGDKGEACKDNIKGAKGESGISGLPGMKGDKGLAGLPGRDGLPGQKGNMGMPGFEGPRGEKGEIGRPGTAGIILAFLRIFKFIIQFTLILKVCRVYLEIKAIKDLRAIQVSQVNLVYQVCRV